MNKLNFKHTFLSMIMILALAGCSSKDDPEPPNLLSGTQWEAFLFTTFLDNEDVYLVLKFTSNTEVESFSYRDDISNISTDIEKLTYTLIDDENFTINNSNGDLVEGTISGNSIFFKGLRYRKQ